MYALLGVLGLIVLWALYSSIAIVGGQNIVVLERRWIGKEMPDGRTVALSNEVGVQARILGPGFHLLWPFIYKRTKHPFVVIKSGQVGLVTAITGESLPKDKIMAKTVDCEFFQDGEAFLKNKGQKGRQLHILPDGEYRINPHLFKIKIEDGVLIQEDEVGIVESIAGKRVERSGGNFGKPVECNNFQDAVAFLENGGEKGPQIDFLEPGYYRVNKLMFNVRVEKQIDVPKGQIALIEAMDGERIEGSRILGKKVEGHKSFYDGQKFIENGGERGGQLEVLMPGQYRINTDLFKVIQGTESNLWIEIGSNEVGIVTTLEGASIKDKSKIAADELQMEVHNNYQNPQAYLDSKGQKGLQIPVLRAGQYAINPWFAKVEKVPMTKVLIGNCGVVTSYVGPVGVDTSEDSVNASIVENGNKGIWKDPLQPGMHPINTKICDVAIVPTIQILLSWANSESQAHKLDDKLKTIVLRTKDAFDVSMDVNVVVHIPMKNAPKVIANLGSVEEMISQVLEPAISAHFRNAAQQTPALELYTKRMELQESAKEHISKVLAEHHIDSKDTLIADVVLPVALTKPVQDTQIAEQNTKMYGIQKLEQDSRIAFENSKEQANQQQAVVESERDVDINKNKALSEIAKAEGEKTSKVLRAEGNAKEVELAAEARSKATKLNGEADGEAIYAVGSNKAKVIKEEGLATAEAYEKQVSAMGEDGFVQMMVMKEMGALKDMKLIPDNVVIGGNGGNGSGGTGDMLSSFMGLSIIEMLTGRKIAPEVREKLEEAVKPAVEAPVAEAAEVEDSFSVEVTDTGSTKNLVAIAIKDNSDMSIRKAKKALESIPAVIAGGLTKEAAETLQKVIVEYGGKAEIKKT